MADAPTDCLHCDINELVQQRIEGQAVDLAELAAMVAESLADLMLLAPKEAQAKLMADVLAHLGSVFLEKGEEADGGGGRARH
jgi:hypothetical protein